MKRSISVSLIIMIVFIVLLYGGKETSHSRRPEKPKIDSDVLKIMQKINKQLAARGLSIAVEAIDFFTIGWGRPSNRIHQEPFRWVPNDPNRLADGENITYLVDQSDGTTSSGLANADTELAIDRALNTWTACKALKKVRIMKRGDTGADPDIFDSFYGFGGFGNPFLADIVNAGWLPKAFFDAVTGDGEHVLAFTVTFIWVDSFGEPTDINGDNRMDTAVKEVYYNDYFYWDIDVELPDFDVETVALHENGHSFEIGHFGLPPIGVMNPVYAGIRQALFPIDKAGMNTVWASWPNP